MSNGESSQVAVRKQDPDEAVAEAKKQADALMKIVNATHISKRIGSKDHLQVEAWQTIARFNRCWIDTEWTRDIKDGDGKVVGVESRARLMRLDDGACLGGAEAACMFDEELERADGSSFGRWDEYYAVKSMAQTRAQGKVGRMAFAWVAVLAGYASTPLEEMDGVKPQDGAPKSITFPFGKHKGQSPRDLDLGDLKGELMFWEVKAKDTKDKFASSNQRLYEAIKQALQEKQAPKKDPTGFPGRVITPAEVQAGLLTPPARPVAPDTLTEDDPRTWAARLWERMERTGKTEAMVRLYLKKAGRALNWDAGAYADIPLQDLVLACQWLSGEPDKSEP